MMQARLLGTTLLITILLGCPTILRAETAQQVFAKGEALLAKGDFQGALASYAAAARADRENDEYLQHYALVRQVIALRGQLGVEKDAQRWQYIARALRSFYVTERLYDEALDLDRQVHARLNTASSAVMLAETALAMNQNAEAAATLSRLALDKATPSTQALLGVALARDGKMAEARRIARELVIPEDAGPRTIYSVARLHAMVGNTEEALSALSRCLESVAPSMQAGFRDHAGRCPDFAALASTPGFAKALATPSKVPESKCSGGSSCAGCPMRGKCPHSQQQ